MVTEDSTLSINRFKKIKKRLRKQNLGSNIKELMNKETSIQWNGTSEALLKALHILTRDGKLNADSRRKLKQVQHLVQLIEPYLQRTLKVRPSLHVVDFGAGKSYLGFLLYDLVLRSIPGAKLTSIEIREELVQKSIALAKESGFERMAFVSSAIETAKPSAPSDAVCALHACDTATDDAILFGIRDNVHSFALVPCCQAEVAAQLDRIPDSEKSPLFRHPIHRREFGSHLTNVIRSLFLSSRGYAVTVTELVGWEHSMKNELILAEKKSTPDHPESLKSQEALKRIVEEYRLEPKLLRGL
jgi:hypothetical protein